MINPLITPIKKAVEDFLESKYSIDKNSIENFDSFSEEVIKNTISLKTWESKLEDSIAISFYREIISNYNQALILGLLGFNVASLSILRRCLENIIVFIYYNEHPVEFKKKEFDVTKRNFDKMEQILVYIKDYPFAIMYPSGNNEKAVKLVTKICEEWNRIYKELSNYVHSSNTQYLDLHTFLIDIKPTKDKLEKLQESFKNITSIVNTLCITFFYSKYDELDAVQKKLIRECIQNKNFTQHLIDYFQEI